nr:unnamed protein product [Spirometra erinaceieuropaei]
MLRKSPRLLQLAVDDFEGLTDCASISRLAFVLPCARQSFLEQETGSKSGNQQMNDTNLCKRQEEARGGCADWTEGENVRTFRLLFVLRGAPSVKPLSPYNMGFINTDTEFSRFGMINNHTTYDKPPIVIPEPMTNELP